MIICSVEIYLVSGDFYIYYKISDKHVTKLLKIILNQYNFTQLITFPTHKANKTIDLCIIITVFFIHYTIHQTDVMTF